MNFQLLDIEIHKILTKAQQCMEQFVDKLEKIKVKLIAFFL